MVDTSVSRPRRTFSYEQRSDISLLAGCRERLRGWLHDTAALDSERLCDIVLAVDEAMANVVDHAYCGSDSDGKMMLAISFEPSAATLCVKVSDHGCWRASAPTARDSVRGRGLHLMKTLADVCIIEADTNGTVVSLSFRNCPER